MNSSKRLHAALIGMLLGFAVSKAITGTGTHRSTAPPSVESSLVSGLARASRPGALAELVRSVRWIGDASVAELTSRWESSSGEERTLILERLAELDPTVAWSVARNTPPHESEAILLWSDRDWLAAMTATEESPNRLSLVFELVAHLPSEEMEGVYEYLKHAGLAIPGSALLTSILKRLTDAHPEMAIAEALPFPDTLQSVIQAWFRQDSDGAIDWFHDQSADQQTKLLPGLWRAWVEQDPLAAATNLWDRLARGDQEHFIKLAKIDHRDPESVARLLKWVDDHVTSATLQRAWQNSIAKAAAAHDPEAYLQSLIETGVTRGILTDNVRSAMEHWYEREPARVRAWVQTLPPGLLRSEALTKFIGLSLAGDPQMALHTLKDEFEASPDSLRGHAHLLNDSLRVYLDTLTPDDAASTMRDLPVPFHGELLEEIARFTGAERPEDVLTLSEKLEPSNRSEMAVQSALGFLAQRDPAAAMAWAKEHMEGKALDLATENVTRAWAKHDPVAAANWVDEQDSHPRGEVLGPVVQSLASIDRERAWSLAQQIQDPQRREQAVLAAIQTLEPSAAQEALHQAPLSSESRSKVNAIITQAAALRQHLLTTAP